MNRPTIRERGYPCLRPGAALAIAMACVSLVFSAHAQTDSTKSKKTDSFLGDFFRNNDQNKPKVRIPSRGETRDRKARQGQAGRQRIKTQREDTRAAKNEPPPPVAVTKAADARVIAVYGDFLAAALEKGLKKAFAASPQLRTIARIKGSSGLVRDDYYNWVAEIDSLLDQDKPDFIVVMLGTNDRQAMLGAQKAPFRSKEWETAYQARIGALIQKLVARKRPVYWVSLPPMRLNGLNRAVAYFNGLYRDATEPAAIRFVDVWNAFADENQNYAARGPDLDGRIRRLRGDDGIGLTAAGRRKLAHFVEREIRRTINDQQDPSIAMLDVTAPAAVIEDTPRTLHERLNAVGPVISLGGIADKDAHTLAGREGAAADGSVSWRRLSAAERDRDPMRQLLDRGAAPVLVEGRADDFSWPRPQ